MLVGNNPCINRFFVIFWVYRDHKMYFICDLSCERFVSFVCEKRNIVFIGFNFSSPIFLLVLYMDQDNVLLFYLYITYWW